MLIDDIKKANIEAMKAHDANKRASLSIVISRYQELATNGSGKKVEDADVLHIIQKVSKELDEEKDGYVKAGRAEQAAAIDLQKAAIESFLPKMLSEDEIRKIIATLPDKAMPVVMKYFKANYDGQVDMGLVSKIARGA
ncbi:MAG: Yqey-like protein [Tenericutes bacterium ADurb.BinA155]|nr:MAG: Yqey-like protein [Tenericutes bacterium ADurb.BinA155]